MATRSEFAQKLLHDLRLRKERMGMAGSQSPNHSSLMSRDTYGNPGQVYRGSRQIKSLESVGSRSVNSKSRPNGGSRSLNIQESSQLMVPYGRRRGGKNVGDLSMALALAFQNGEDLSSGKGSMLSFVHQVQRGSSMGVTKMGRRTGLEKHHHQPTPSQFTFSNLQVQEIAKGIQNINQILRACSQSNGLNFDRYSIEIGKELLKGAMDLEESLRMLVNLQEASEYMIKPQRKNKIRLLEEDEEEEENEAEKVEQKQQDLPRFSFDKPSRNSYQVKNGEKADLKDSNLAMVMHRKSSSCCAEFKAFSSQYISEKGRISNVIAKLMGLDEIPQKADLKTATGKVLSSKPKESVGLNKTGKTSRAGESRTGVVENLVHSAAEKKLAPNNKMPPALNPSSSISKSKKIQSIPIASLDTVVHAKPHWQDMEMLGKKMSDQGSKREMVKIDEQHKSIRQSISSQASQKKFQGGDGGNDQTRNKEKKGVGGRTETKELIANDKLQRKAQQEHVNSEVENTLQENVEFKKSSPLNERRSAERLVAGNQHKPPESHGLYQHKIKGQKPEQLTGKQNLLTLKCKASRAEMNSSRHMNGAAGLLKKQPYMNQATHFKRSSNGKIDVRLSKDAMPKIKQHGDSAKNASVGDQTSEAVTQNLIQKEESAQAHRGKPAYQIDETKARRNETPHNNTRRLRQQSPISQVIQRRRQDTMSVLKQEKLSTTKSNEKEDTQIVEPNNSSASIETLNDKSRLHIEAEQPSTKPMANGEECKIPTALDAPMLNDIFQVQASEVCKVPEDHLGQAPVSDENPEPKISDATPNLLNGTGEGSTEGGCLLPNEHKVISSSGAQKLLTEPEKRLKETLMKSKIFLNAADALFNLNIPYSILDAGDNTCPDEDMKLTLDCAYEVMKRKARRYEQNARNQFRFSIIKVNTLDDLVSQIHGDFDRLRFYGGNGSVESNAADYLHKILERDVQNRVPEVNCMWDYGWSNMPISCPERDDVMKELERDVLNGLLDEMTRDLLPI